MKKNIAKRLTLPKETVRALQVQDLEIVAGGATTNIACGTCGHPHSTCPIGITL
jgi:hypothetical protein